jgi:hypothetical protein
MNIATWGEQTNTALEDDPPYFSILHLWVGATSVGTVFRYSEAGPCYAMSQVRRFGAYGELEVAKHMVETCGLFDAVAYQTKGNA